ncbi:MAG: bifunctional fucokinase/L-fucose-1-P-guanylyltransferase [Phycisphaera sp.]|nr:bifunctional fucokinase/L-fucose-1-P-guanylyltransferase [Phycisphaera sp.]
MQTLISVPGSLVDQFHRLTGLDQRSCYVASDPPDRRLGSGGGTAHLVHSAWQHLSPGETWQAWAQQDRRIILHAGGHSRRLPAYAPIGKALIPIPTFRWMTGQRLDQTLLDIQQPILASILDRAPGSLRWVIASGDVLLWLDAPLENIPEADVVCVGLTDVHDKASNHGVFFTRRDDPTRLVCMRQKPSRDEVQQRAASTHPLLDVGVWLLSQRAMDALMRACGWDEKDQNFKNKSVGEYDLYSQFGPALGEKPDIPTPGVSELSVAVLPLPEAEFYHFGSSTDLIDSSLALQNREHDPRRILSALPKPHPSIFTQNAVCATPLGPANRQVWIENAVIGSGWTLRARHVVTGIPEGVGGLDLPEGVCVDMVPIGESQWALRPYGFSDPFRGAVGDASTLWMGRSFGEWLTGHGLKLDDLDLTNQTDIQMAPIFPVVESPFAAGAMLRWMIGEPSTVDQAGRERYLKADRLSANELSDRANLARLYEQKTSLLARCIPQMVAHAHRSVIHQIDLDHAARVVAGRGLNVPEGSPDPQRDLFPYIRDRMFRYLVSRESGHEDAKLEAQAFASLRDAIVQGVMHKTPQPRNTLLADQVIWARSPVRLDLAGGWTDTPPYCLLNGGKVVNLAVDLNGQQPIQVFVRTTEEPTITLRSIDLGSTETCGDYDAIARYAQVGSGFSIPKAALALAGFHPDFSSNPYPSLEAQLRALGGGIELSMLCAIPKGSGLGTSSILAATLLAALSDLCGHHWGRMEIANRTLTIEQLLTTGGGWQDQFGGILPGVKSLETTPGLRQSPEVRWLPETLFTDPMYRSCLMLYYTGVTRVARGILAEIVRGMFLNRRETLSVLRDLGRHADHMQRVIQHGNFTALGIAIDRTWQLNQALDSGTNPPATRAILAQVQDHLLGAKLLGAGGGGYFLFVAKDPQAAGRVRQSLTDNPPNARARFVDLSVSTTGLVVTRS